MTACRSARLKHQNRRPLGLESLEDRRQLAATHLVLDFTPDYRQGSLADTYNAARYANGTRPAFLDFNGDQRITSQDIDQCAAAITNVVRTYFSRAASGLSVTVVGGDTGQSNFGHNYLNWGRPRASDQVLVVYVGGRGGPGQLGMAPQAPDGYNVEGYGQAYPTTLALSMMNRPGVTKDHFAIGMGHAIAHEFGHMLGLRHANNYPGDIMNPAQGSTPWSDAFSNQNRVTQGGPAQNATTELRNSFWGQSTVQWGYNGGSALMEREHAEHGHDQEAHNHIDEVAESFDLDWLFDSIESTASTEPISEELPALDATFGSQAKPQTAAPLGARPLPGKPQPIEERSGLLTLLARDLHSSLHDSDRDTPSKSATNEAALADLFADFGLVQAK